jgi:hypothetical protein
MSVSVATALRLSLLGERALAKKKVMDKHATLGKMQSPVALQLRQALAMFCVPEEDPLVIAAACEKLAVERPGHCPDVIAAIF